MIERIVSLYGEHVLSRSAVRSASDRAILCRAVSDPAIQTVLEIGTYRGCAAAVLSQLCRKVITIDLVNGWLERQGEQFDRTGFWDSLGIGNIEFHPVRDEEQKAECIEAMRFDMAFIDGEHDDTVHRDFDLVRRCGRVLFHDVNPAQPKKNAVYSLVKDLGAEVGFDGNFAYWQAD